MPLLPKAAAPLEGLGEGHTPLWVRTDGEDLATQRVARLGRVGGARVVGVEIHQMASRPFSGHHVTKVLSRPRPRKRVAVAIAQALKLRERPLRGTTGHRGRRTHRPPYRRCAVEAREPVGRACGGEDPPCDHDRAPLRLQPRELDAVLEALFELPAGERTPQLIALQIALVEILA